MQRGELDTWLGPALHQLEPEQIYALEDAARTYRNLPGYDADDGERNDAVVSAMVQHMLGELDLAGTGLAYRRARLAAEAAALGAVLAGMPEAQAARESTLDRMKVRRMLGKR